MKKRERKKKKKKGGKRSAIAFFHPCEGGAKFIGNGNEKEKENGKKKEEEAKTLLKIGEYNIYSMPMSMTCRIQHRYFNHFRESKHQRLYSFI